MAMNDPRELFLHGLKDVYYVENALLKALPELSSEASDRELTKSLDEHLRQTRGHVKNVERVFELMGETPKAEPCIAFEGLTKEHEKLVEETSGDLIDMVDLGAAARTENYEIAAYEGLRRMAKGLGEDRVVDLLDENLKQEKEALKLVESIGKRMAKDAKQLVNA